MRTACADPANSFISLQKRQAVRPQRRPQATRLEQAAQRPPDRTRRGLHMAAAAPRQGSPEKIMMKKMRATTSGCAASCLRMPCGNARVQGPRVMQPFAGAGGGMAAAVTATTAPIACRQPGQLAAPARTPAPSSCPSFGGRTARSWRWQRACWSPAPGNKGGRVSWQHQGRQQAAVKPPPQHAAGT